MVKISIIIPVYNAEMFIEQAIQSVLAQTLSDYELIIVNDGSTDNSGNIIRKYMVDPRVKYYFQDNFGESYARNVGLKKAIGEYIAFLDADDIYSIEKLEKQILFLNTHQQYDAVYNDAICIDVNGNEIGYLKSEEKIEDSKNLLAYILYRQIIPASASMMFRRKSIQDIYYPEEYRFAEDYAFILKVAEKCRIGYLNEPLYFYRRHNNNLTVNHQKQVESENDIVRSLGLEKITKIVMESNYSLKEKEILLVKILMKINEWHNSLAVLERVRKKDWDYYYLSSIIHYKLNNINKSIKSLEKSLEIECTAEALNNLGCCYAKVGLCKKAIKYFESASELRENYNDPLYNLTAIVEKRDLKITERKLRKELTIYKG